MAAQPMGMGQLGFRNLIFKRKFRWTFQVQDICGGQKVPEHYVKVAARPNLSIEETEINFLNGKKWIPGKGTWETITVTYYDVATNLNAPLFSWLASVYNFTDSVNLQMGSAVGDYSANAMIKLFDGCGQTLEQWTLGDCWPQAINFGELDYSSSEECTIELTIRYSQVDYKPICPTFTITSCCTPCNSTTGFAGTGVTPNGQGVQVR